MSLDGARARAGGLLVRQWGEITYLGNAHLLSFTILYLHLFRFSFSHPSGIFCPRADKSWAVLVYVVPSLKAVSGIFFGRGNLLLVVLPIDWSGGLAERSGANGMNGERDKKGGGGKVKKKMRRADNQYIPGLEIENALRV